jgi:hypothetical protein
VTGSTGANAGAGGGGLRCMWFNTPQGCRNGSRCTYVHDGSGGGGGGYGGYRGY